MKAEARENEVLKRFSQLNVYSQGGARAPHKPLLVLLALSKWASGDHGPWAFSDIAPKMRELITEFGVSAASARPEYPFWRLQKDSLWVVDCHGHPIQTSASGDVSAAVLSRLHADGSFSPEVRIAFSQNPGLLIKVAQKLLEVHFAPSNYDRVLSAVNLELDRIAIPRDPRFRTKVLTAYDWRCAICGFGARLMHTPIGLDTAHIRWASLGGPSVVCNALALCALHHVVFDAGGLTVEAKSKIILVSGILNGNAVYPQLRRWHGKKIRAPHDAKQAPLDEYLLWHRRNVFREGPSP